uniref:Uncharacterized protein n=1 Tax=Sus scrofa TaxID=9823 RepID=A0A4X1V9W3_PIG
MSGAGAGRGGQGSAMCRIIIHWCVQKMESVPATLALPFPLLSPSSSPPTTTPRPIPTISSIWAKKKMCLMINTLKTQLDLQGSAQQELYPSVLLSVSYKFWIIFLIIMYISLPPGLLL